MLRRFALAAGLPLALLAAGCGASDGSPSPPAAGTATREPALSATLNASGATFPKGFCEVAVAAYKKVQPGVTVNYSATGSGAGRQALQDGVVDFAGSDGLVNPNDLSKYKGEFVYIPTVAAPITVTYNLTDVKDLTLDADTIAKIFQRQIKKWDDAAIAAQNPGVRLPATDITVAHRADGSGTTETSPSTWSRRRRTPGRSGPGRPWNGRTTPRPGTATRAWPRS